MAEPLKNSFGTQVPRWVAEQLTAVAPEFDSAQFLTLALDGYDDLELTPRAKQIASALAEVLPRDRRRAMELIMKSLGDPVSDAELTGMEGFRYLPYVFFVAAFGLDDFETAMKAQEELTKRFTAEFSIRAFLEHHPDRTLAQLREWATDDNVHVRRLVSEGSRPRLPWAPRLRQFQRDPTPVLDLLELLKDDPEEYVRRSVANNLNDIAKDHPDLVVDLCRRWWTGADDNRRKLIRHGLRTLIKQGRLDALAVIGYSPHAPVTISASANPSGAIIGDRVRIDISADNPSPDRQQLLIDVIVHFVKANHTTSPKVFKGGELDLGPGERATIAVSISLKQHTTRTHHPGHHRIEIQCNGVVVAATEFELAGDGDSV